MLKSIYSFVFISLISMSSVLADSVSDSKQIGAEVAGSLKAKGLTSSANALRNGLEDYKDLTGLQGVDLLSSPGSKGRTGLANISVSNGINFSCATSSPDRVYTAGLISFKVLSCSNAGNNVESVKVSYCDKAMQAGTCVSDNFDKTATIIAGNSVNISGGTIAIGCNANELNCRFTSNITSQFGGSDTSLKNGGVSRADSSEMASGLYGFVANGKYGETMDSTASLIKPSSEVPESCEEQRVCSKQSTLTKTYQRSCTRTFPLTEQVTTYSYEGLTATCDIKVVKDLKLGLSTTNTCDGSPAKNAGMSKIGATDKVCDSTDCSEYHLTEYYANTSQEAAKIVKQYASPSQVGGACDVTPESQLATCPAGSWFGRTETDVNCKASMTDENGYAIAQATDIDFSNKEGCGFCVSPTVGKTCYAVNSPSNMETLGGADSVDSCAVLDTNPQCKLVSSTPSEGGTMGSLVISQTDTYDCTESTTVCTQYSTANSCVKVNTFGTENAGGTDPVNYDAMSNALVSLAILDSTAQGVEGDQDASVPRIFGGSLMQCTRATSGIGQLFGRNCCKISLERPIEGFLTKEGCTLDHAKLAAARRSNYATYIGEYCSKKTRFPSKCLQRTQSYCTFQGILPRIVQEQGRRQLANLASSSVGANYKTGSINYSFYDSTTEGHWSSPVNVNGSLVSAWQWPSYCSDPVKAEVQLAENPDSKECPGALATFFAACSVGESCGALPSEPSAGSYTWDIMELDPLTPIATAISKYAAVSGACSTSSYACNYSISAYPAGQGGKAVVTRNITFPLFMNEVQADGNVMSYQAYQVNNVGDLMFKGYSNSGKVGDATPSAVRVDVSTNGGQTWTSLGISTSAYKATSATIPGSDVTVSGYCDPSSNSCSYNFTGTITVTAKPFGSPKNPDCSGFTAGQLSALDFGKMDLSEWLNTVMAKVKGNTSAVVAGNAAASASQQVAQFNSYYSQGVVGSSSPTGANVARAVPAEGFGPFNVKLVVSGVWPEITGDPEVDKDIISKVTVDWGDCGASETLQKVTGGTGVGFTSVHRYVAPNEYACLGSPHKNVTHNIKLTIYTTYSGVQSKTVYVENAWAEFPGGNSNNLNVNKSTAGSN